MKFVKGMEFTSTYLRKIRILRVGRKNVVYTFPEHTFPKMFSDTSTEYKLGLLEFELAIKAKGYKPSKSSVIKLFFEQ